MRTITVTGNETIQIGRRGENQATQIIWTNILENWRTMYGDGVVQLAVRRPNDTAPYPAACEVIGNDIMWTIQAADTAQNGAGECELSYIVDAVLVKSQTWDTMIARSLTGDGTVDPPSEPSKTWFSKIQSEIGNLEDLGTGDKSNLVAAINEAAQSGGGGGSTVELDTTLTQSGKAADAKAVGDALDNCVMVGEIDQEGGQGEFIPLLSADGTEYRFYIGNDGIPAVMDVNGRVVWTGTSGGSGGSGGDTGESWVNGETVHITEAMLIQNEYVNSINGKFAAYDGWGRTSYINCVGAKQIRFNLDSGQGHRSDGYNAFYGISKYFIKSFKNGLPSRENTGSNYPTYVDVPDGACYFVLSWPHEDIMKLSYTLYDTVQEVTG